MSAPLPPSSASSFTSSITSPATDSDDAIWTPIATCWSHKDGKGMNIPIPFIGHFVIREITVKDDAGEY